MRKLGRLIFGVVLAACAIGAAHAQASTQAAPPPASTPVLRVGDTLYMSGTRVAGAAPEDPAVEATMMLDTIKSRLVEQGMSMDDLVSVTIFCTDLKLYDTFNKVYRGYFRTPLPTRAFIGAHELLAGAHFEMMGVAQKGFGATKK